MDLRLASLELERIHLHGEQGGHAAHSGFSPSQHQNRLGIGIALNADKKPGERQIRLEHRVVQFDRPAQRVFALRGGVQRLGPLGRVFQPRRGQSTLQKSPGLQMRRRNSGGSPRRF